MCAAILHRKPTWRDRFWVLRQRFRTTIHCPYKRLYTRTRKQGATILPLVWPNCWFSQLHHPLESLCNSVSWINSIRTKLLIVLSSKRKKDTFLVCIICHCFTVVSGGMLTVFHLGSTETTKMKALVIQTSREWEFILACGMQTIGQLEVGLSRPTGPVPHS